MPTATINRDRLKRLFTHLVDIYSPSGKEAQVATFITQYLRRAGFEVIRQEVDSDRHNILVIPEGQEPELLLIGHIDTVPAYDFDNYEADEHGDEIFGLGTADMKGGCAAMIEALHVCLESGQMPPVALALVVGEEESGDGTMELLREYRFPWAIVGEPTDLKPCLSHYSYIEMNLEATGKRMHASMAKQGRNAILRMLQVLSTVIHYLDNERPGIVYNVRDLTSSHKGFSVPDFCECWLDLHAPPDLPTSELRAEIEEVLHAGAKQNRSFETSASFLTIHAGYHLPDRGLVPEALQRIFKERGLEWKPDAFPSHSDANLLWAGGTKPLLLGPGRLDKAHTSDESVVFSQIYEAASIYLDLIRMIENKPQQEN
jgi:acetylornithine deacetylase